MIADSRGIDERGDDAQRKREKRAQERDLCIPPCANPKRRLQALADARVFLKTYFPKTFYQPFTQQRNEMIDSILGALESKTSQAIAASRGEGKSTITECLIIFCLLKGIVSYGVLIGATDDFACDTMLANVKIRLVDNDLLAEDFPELVIPLRDVETAPQRRLSQTVNGKLTRLRWGQSEIVFPTVMDSVNPDQQAIFSGAILRASGITGSGIRGLKRGDKRPDLVIIDDPDDEESADSDPKIIKRIKKIERSLKGLPAPGERIAMVMLCTLINSKCVAALYTDFQQMPSWNGRRFKMLLSLPTNLELWEKYIELREKNQLEGDEHSRGAHQHYLDNRAEMDAGAELANPYRFDDTQLSDGSQVQVSALQFCFDFIADARNGWDDFNTEYQNEIPDAEDNDESREITYSVVRSRLSGWQQGIVPDDSEGLVAFIDLNKRFLTWQANAYSARNYHTVIDYGQKQTFKPDVVAEKTSIRVALDELTDDLLENPYFDSEGNAHKFEVILIDCGHWNDVVYEIVKKKGRPLLSSMGVSSFRMPKKKGNGKIPGDQWYHSKQAPGLHVVNINTNHWKHEVHEGYVSEPFDDHGMRRPRSIALHGDDRTIHTTFAKQTVAEIWIRRFEEGKGWKEGWEERSRDNHYLDTNVGCQVAASVAKQGNIPGWRAVSGKSSWFQSKLKGGRRA